MRHMLSAIAVALVLLTAAFLFVVPTAGHGSTSATHPSTGLRTAVAPNYQILMQLATQPVLPGYHNTLFYAVENLSNGAPVLKLSTITIRGTYYNTGLQLLKFPGTPINVSTAPLGSWNFIVPANATANGAFAPTLRMWANSTSLGMNQTQSLAIRVGTLQIHNPSVCDLLGVCGALVVGNPSAVSLSAVIVPGFGPSGPAPNETVKILYFSTGSSPVTVPGVPASLRTNSIGQAAETFSPNSTVFNVPGPNHVQLQVIDSVNASLSVFVNVTWTLENPAGTTDFAFWLNSSTYNSGSPVTASWQWRGTNATVGTLNVTNYAVFDSGTNAIIANGLIGSKMPTGSFTFALPPAYFGNFRVDAYVHNSSLAWTLQAVATAYLATLTITPSEFYYNVGDTVTVIVTPQGPATNGATISAFVQATDSGQTLFSATVTSGQFSFTIPAVAPAGSYNVVAWASTPTSGTVARASLTLYEAAGFTFWAGIDTPSSYSDGSFAPGQSVQLSYKVVPYGLATLPTLVKLYVYPGGCALICTITTPAFKSWVVTSASGTVSFTIPSDTPNGLQSFNIYATFHSGSGSDQVTLNINSAPSALNYELGAGSGLTVGWLILLILIVIGGLFIFSMMRRGGRLSTMVMSRTAASPSSSAAEWKEPASGGTSGGSAPPPATPPGA